MGRQDIRDHINGLYFKSGKLKDGKGATEILTRKGEKSYCATEHSTSTAENKCKDMFRGHILEFKSRKRSKKENKTKAQKKNARREEENCGLIFQLMMVRFQLRKSM